MNLNDNNKALRITFQAIIISAMIFNFMGFIVPGGWNAKSIAMLIFTIVSCAGLIFIIVRVSKDNVKRWEMLLYNILNVIFMIIIINCIRELAFEAMDYNKSIATNDDAYDDAEGIGLSAMFRFILFGIPSIIITTIFSIIGIIMTFVKNGKEVIPNGIQQTEMHTNNIKSSEIQINNVQPINTDSNENLEYCRYCGKRINEDSKFCKYCGKQLK